MNLEFEENYEYGTCRTRKTIIIQKWKKKYEKK